MIDHTALKEKFKALQALFGSVSTTSGSVQAALALLKGAHPGIDRRIAECEKHLSVLEKLERGAVIELSAEALPEATEEQKKRKRALLLFIRSWKSLKNEVARVQSEWESQSQQGSGNTSMWARIVSATAGPLAIFTVLAIGLAALHTVAVTVNIHNDGCGTLQTETGIPISLPGLALPQGAIENGSSAEATLPPLTISVDGGESGTLLMSALGMRLSFELPGVDDITFDGVSLLGVHTEIKLSKEKTHELRIICQN